MPFVNITNPLGTLTFEGLEIRVGIAARCGEVMRVAIPTRKLSIYLRKSSPQEQRQRRSYTAENLDSSTRKGLDLSFP